MNKFAIIVFSGAITIALGASAQQLPQQPTHHGQHLNPAGHVIKNPYPMPAARYEITVSKSLQALRAMHPMGPITQGDINKALLLVRDCAMRVEADGIVTMGEMRMCNNMFADLKRQVSTQAMANSTTSDWERWAAQNGRTPPHHN
jgi:hypothetical protein